MNDAPVTPLRGLILMAHGARDPRWAEPFERTAERVRELCPGQLVALAYLELMAPDLAACGHGLVQAGCGEVDVLPLFLGAGGHVRKDLPQLVERLQAAHPQVRWRLQQAVGESPVLVEAMAQLGAAVLNATTSTTSPSP
ncbi:MAG TPA: CbiX/SirB N-terminal domain-containing protein [Ideonella sp.]|nr:CbiX/SirB N-terminal domain-containing protein [Ideonella sp.]